MLAAFIEPVEWITLPLPAEGGAYPGVCARSRFLTSAYSDTLYPAAGIPFPDELTRAVPKRRAEFLAGRYLARQVLARLGVARFTLPRGQDRAPCWPQGICGALSHNTDVVLCAAHPDSERFSGVGVDVETIMPAARAQSLWSAIVSDEEYRWLLTREMDFASALTLNFSAKESLFKALYPRVRRYFGFMDARMTRLDPVRQVFELALQTTLTPEYPAGRCFRGRYLLTARDVTTFLCS